MSFCKTALAGVEGARAVAVIDRGSGEVLASAGGAALASSGTLLLQPEALAAFESLVGLKAGSGGEAHEVHISTADDDRLLRVVHGRQAVAILAYKSANIALTWAQLKTVVSKREEIS